MTTTDQDDEWRKVKDQFPAVLRKDHPFYDMIETFNEDTGEIIPPGTLVEADYNKGFVRHTVPGARAEVQRTSVGAWRARWRKDKRIRVEDTPHGYHMAFTGCWYPTEDDGA